MVTKLPWLSNYNILFDNQGSFVTTGTLGYYRIPVAGIYSLNVVSLMSSTTTPVGVGNFGIRMLSNVQGTLDIKSILPTINPSTVSLTSVARFQTNETIGVVFFTTNTSNTYVVNQTSFNGFYVSS